MPHSSSLLGRAPQTADQEGIHGVQHGNWFSQLRRLTSPRSAADKETRWLVPTRRWADSGPGSMEVKCGEKPMSQLENSQAEHVPLPRGRSTRYSNQAVN